MHLLSEEKSLCTVRGRHSIKSPRRQCQPLIRYRPVNGVNSLPAYRCPLTLDSEASLPSKLLKASVPHHLGSVFAIEPN